MKGTGLSGGAGRNTHSEVPQQQITLAGDRPQGWERGEVAVY